MMLMTWLVRGVAAVAAVVVLGAAVPAAALPPDGAGSDTPGTSASVTPRSLPPGGVIRFTVSGFPAGETVYIKIDDGASCSVDAAQGACVYHSQKLDSRGSASGSFSLPADLAPGPHWLRFLASEEVLDAQGDFQGTKGYTRRGGADFAITAPAAPADGTTGRGGSGSTDDGSSAGSTGSGPSPTAGAPGTATAPGASSVTDRGEVVVIQPLPDVTATPEPAPSPTPTPVATAAPTTADVAAPADDSRFPVIGAVGFALMLVAAVGLVGWTMRRPSSPG